MEKNKSLYMTLVVLVCSLFAFLGAFYLGTYFSVGKNIVNEEVSDNNTKINLNTINIPNYNENVNVLLYNYLNNNKDNLNFNDYINKGLTNNQKLYVAGIFTNHKFRDLEDNLIEVFGSTLNLKSEDYYLPGFDDAPFYIYNKDTLEYNGNVLDIFGTDVLTDLLPVFIYNYKIDSIEYIDDGFIVTYYGLFGSYDTVGPTCIYNDSDINRCLGFDSQEDGVSDLDYLEGIFNENKDRFFKFSYTYKKMNKNYVLVDFKKVD